MLTTTTLTIEMDAEGFYFYGPAEFEIDQETYPAEPYSWGGSRGTETETDVKLMSVKTCKLSLNRSQITDAVGAEEIDRVEAEIADQINHSGFHAIAAE